MSATDLQEKLLEPSRRERRLQSKWQAWQISVLLGATVSLMIFGANTALLLWVKKHHTITQGVAKIFTGDCNVSSRAGTIFHLAVNIISTVLLGASNMCAQLLSAPNRRDIAKAHAKKNWLDIGVPSIRNLYGIPRWRTSCWALLFLSSVPLHLMYNSVVFTTFSARNYNVAMVTTDFLDQGWWNETRFTTDHRHSLAQLQKDHHGLENLTTGACLASYSSSTSATNWGNLLIVASASLNDSVLHVNDFITTDRPTWADGFLCGPGQNISIHKDSSNCTLPAARQCPDEGISGKCTHQNTTIEFCLADKLEPQCTVRISTTILMIVIACNLIKVLVMMITALVGFVPLATIGDAIASFLEDPDISMEAQGPLSIFDVRSGAWKRRLEQSQRPPKFERRIHFWQHAVSMGRINRWSVFVIPCFCMWIVGLAFFLVVFLAKGLPIESLGNQTDAYTADTLIKTSLDATLFSNILLVNTPQLLISYVYVFCNNAVTGMLLGNEFGNYASNRKPLRVSRPVGDQRSTYWLQLPYRWVLPLMSSMALLHWLVSRSIFLVQLEIFDANNAKDLVDTINACGYSVIFIIPALFLGFALIFSVVGVSYMKLDPGIPIVASCSLAISAACANSMESDASKKPVKYGVLTSRGKGPYGSRYVGFSAMDVEPLEWGESYL